MTVMGAEIAAAVTILLTLAAAGQHDDRITTGPLNRPDDDATQARPAALAPHFGYGAGGYVTSPFQYREVAVQVRDGHETQFRLYMHDLHANRYTRVNYRFRRRTPPPPVSPCHVVLAHSHGYRMMSSRHQNRIRSAESAEQGSTPAYTEELDQQTYSTQVGVMALPGNQNIAHGPVRPVYADLSTSLSAGSDSDAPIAVRGSAVACAEINPDHVTAETADCHNRVEICSDPACNDCSESVITTRSSESNHSSPTKSPQTDNSTIEDRQNLSIADINDNVDMSDKPAAGFISANNSANMETKLPPIEDPSVRASPGSACESTEADEDSESLTIIVTLDQLKHFVTKSLQNSEDSARKCKEDFAALLRRIPTPKRASFVVIKKDAKAVILAALPQLLTADIGRIMAEFPPLDITDCDAHSVLGEFERLVFGLHQLVQDRLQQLLKVTRSTMSRAWMRGFVLDLIREHGQKRMKRVEGDIDRVRQRIMAAYPGVPQENTISSEVSTEITEDNSCCVVPGASRPELGSNTVDNELRHEFADHERRPRSSASTASSSAKGNITIPLPSAGVVASLDLTTTEPVPECVPATAECSTISDAPKSSPSAKNTAKRRNHRQTAHSSSVNRPCSNSERDTNAMIDDCSDPHTVDTLNTADAGVISADVNGDEKNAAFQAKVAQLLAETAADCMPDWTVLLDEILDCKLGSVPESDLDVERVVQQVGPHLHDVVQCALQHARASARQPWADLIECLRCVVEIMSVAILEQPTFSLFHDSLTAAFVTYACEIQAVYVRYFQLDAARHLLDLLEAFVPHDSASGPVQRCQMAAALLPSVLSQIAEQSRQERRDAFRHLLSVVPTELQGMLALVRDHILFRQEGRDIEWLRERAAPLDLPGRLCCQCQQTELMAAAEDITGRHQLSPFDRSFLEMTRHRTRIKVEEEIKGVCVIALGLDRTPVCVLKRIRASTSWQIQTVIGRLIESQRRHAIEAIKFRFATIANGMIEKILERFAVYLKVKWDRDQGQYDLATLGGQILAVTNQIVLDCTEDLGVLRRTFSELLSSRDFAEIVLKRTTTALKESNRWTAGTERQVRLQVRVAFRDLNLANAELRQQCSSLPLLRSWMLLEMGCHLPMCLIPIIHRHKDAFLAQNES